MHLLPFLRRQHSGECLSELRGRILLPADPARARLEMRRLSRRLSGKHGCPASPSGSDPSQAFRRVYQIHRPRTSVTFVTLTPTTPFPGLAARPGDCHAHRCPAPVGDHDEALRLNQNSGSSDRCPIHNHGVDGSSRGAAQRGRPGQAVSEVLVSSLRLPPTGWSRFP